LERWSRNVFYKFISKAIPMMKKLRIRFELAIWNCFLTSVILLWPIFELFDTGWLVNFKDNVTASVDHFIKEFEKDL
jgi:hypothetical protein